MSKVRGVSAVSIVIVLLAGLLACGAAVTVVVTSGETSSGSPAQAPRADTPPTGPLALPPPPAAKRED